MVKCHTTYTGRARRVQRWGVVALLSFGALAGCVEEAEILINPYYPDEVFRNPSVTLAATSRFDADRFAGKWDVIGCLGPCGSTIEFTARGDRITIDFEGGETVTARLTAPGVLRFPGFEDPVVVMWVDEGFRTAAMGSADGGWAVIIDRKRPGGADRIKAATEILDFNGWDISKLREVNG